MIENGDRIMNEKNKKDDKWKPVDKEKGTITSINTDTKEKKKR